MPATPMFLLAWLMVPLLAAQTSVESLAVFTEHPRLFLRPRRLRLLQRERERGSMRWQQFQALVRGGASLAEPGFNLALYYKVTGDAEAGRRAVAWALSPGADARQIALVFDWCQELLTAAQSRALVSRLRAGIERAPAGEDVSAVRARVLAAVVLADHTPGLPARVLNAAVRDWWQARIVRSLHAGKDAIPREDVYALYEILHAVRDNTLVDLREDVPKYFQELPAWHLLSHYPATFRSAEGEFRLGAAARVDSAPDLRAAALSRAAELSMVAFDSNATESQYLQGWLMYDRFLLRDNFGAAYEFLWANPYQPGLSYLLMPLVWHDPRTGRLFARASWEESSAWLGCFSGVVQWFDQGRVTVLDPRVAAPVTLNGTTVLFPGSAKATLRLEEGARLYGAGFKPGVKYVVEANGKVVGEPAAGAGGILELPVPPGETVRVEVREAPPARNSRH